MKGPPRLILSECVCGLIRRIRITSDPDLEAARRLFEEQCPVCGNTGGGRVYTIVPLHPLRIVKK